MSISNYGELKTAVANWMRRSDLTDRIPEFIASGLQRVNNDLLLRNGIPDQEQVAIATTVADQLSLAWPSDFSALRWIKRDYSTVADALPLRSMGYDEMVETYGSTTGAPEAYTSQDASFYFGPIPDAAYVIRIGYIKRYAAFSADVDTNYLLTNGSNILLWAALMEANVYMGDDARTSSLFVPAYQGALEGLRLMARRSRHARPQMQMVDAALLGSTTTGDVTTGC